MKLLIADDEVQIRKGLRMKVKWEKEGFDRIEEASNGREALDVLSKMDIDIVITDIKMPIVDGIEFSRICHREHPNVKILALSGYSDYEYLRSAMKEGVKDYLLKPVAPDELVAAVRKLREEVTKEKRKQRAANHLQEIQEQYLLHLIKEEWSEIHMEHKKLRQLQLEDLSVEGAKVQFITVEMRNSKENPEVLRELWLPFQMLCKEIAQEQKRTYCIYDPSYANMLHFIHRLDVEQSICSKSLAEKVQRYAKDYLKLETAIGIGTVVTGLTEFKNGYISSLLSWSQSLLGSHSQVIEGAFAKEVFDLSTDFERKVINAIENINREAFTVNISSLLGENCNHSIQSFSYVANRLLLLLGSSARKYEIDTMDIQRQMWVCQLRIWELNSQMKVLNHLVQIAQSIMDEIQKTRYSKGKITIESIRQYIDQHYSDEITLTSLSEKFFINSAYLSELFKNHIGQTFSDYLIKLRINKAMLYLKDEQLKIIDVANLVGFSNSGYFSTVFKKYVGQTPVEYRRSIQLSD
ncbi:response regulator [Bacillus gobiensis]|uniref:response regulator transcription factor n=1 Tax=Bacillus gobiensis TaxID=1441095 RepID=UPI003D1945C7